MDAATELLDFSFFYVIACQYFTIERAEFLMRRERETKVESRNDELSKITDFCCAAKGNHHNGDSQRAVVDYKPKVR